MNFFLRPGWEPATVLDKHPVLLTVLFLVQALVTVTFPMIWGLPRVGGASYLEKVIWVYLAVSLLGYLVVICVAAMKPPTIPPPWSTPRK